MSAGPRSRRPRNAVAAGCTAMALVAGCGGSDVQEATNAADNAATAPDTRAAAPDTGTTGATVPETDTAPAPAPEAPADTTTGTAPSTDPTNPAGTGADAPADTAVEPGAPTVPDTGTDPGRGKSPGAAKAKKAPQGAGSDAATGGGSAVEKLVAANPIFGGSAPCKPATLSEVRIGNVSTLSGVLGELLSPVVPALETFVAAQNACGGLNGHRIKLFIEDDQGDPATAVTKVQTMIQGTKVLAFVGNLQPLSIDAIIPTIKNSGIPIIGGDLVSNTWFQNPLLFPQGSPPQAVSYGFLKGAVEYHKKTNVGDLYCVEVPRACEQIDRAFKELAPGLGATVKSSVQASIVQPSYVQQCLDFKNSGVEALAIITDAPTMVRMARSCEQVGYFPKLMPTPLGVGNAKQFLTGNKWLGDSYVPMFYFPWFATETAAQKYWHASIAKYNPGFDLGGSASVGWTAGALLVAAAAELNEANPTSADLLKVLHTFKGQKFTELGGLSGPKTFREGDTPKVPYCLFAAISNADNTGWAKAIAKPECTDVLAPSDPQRGS